MKITKCILALAGIIVSSTAWADELPTEQVGHWNNVVSFSINGAGDHMVMVMQEADGIRELVYESVKQNGVWTEAVPIDNINNRCNEDNSIGGVFLTSDEQRIYFHANFSAGVGGYDIYYSEMTADGWSKPILDREISTAADERYPALTPGGQTIYFLRHQVVSDFKLEKKEADRQSVYSAVCAPDGKWTKAEPINNVINSGYIQDVNVLHDGVTLFYSIRADRKEESIAYFARTHAADVWSQPDVLFVDKSGYDYYSPNMAKDKLYVIKSNNKKRHRAGTIMSMTCKAVARPKPTVVDNGKIVAMGSGKPVKADVVVYNPTSLKVIGKYKSSESDGSFCMETPVGADYIVDIRSNGYSFASQQLSYPKQCDGLMPKTIELFDTINLVMSVFDSEIFRPLESKVIAVRTVDKAIFRSKKVSDGRYVFNLPLGSNYNIIATSKNFAENKFLFKLGGDVVFSTYERELPLSPQKMDFVVRVVDADTKAPLNADIVFSNVNREEKVAVSKSQVTNGVSNVKLRNGDGYDLFVGGVSNYSYYNSHVDVKSETACDIYVELIPLRANASLRLNNIQFETGSADLLQNSYVELDRVVKMLEENPQLKFEISAHTDNVGNQGYNMLLSQRRAESVSAYLQENGVTADRFVVKGYGMTKPLVPNTSDENKAMNRRVEFKVLGNEQE